MIQRLRANHALSWAAIGLAAACAAVACLVPAFRLRIEAYIGAGATQRAFDYGQMATIALDSRVGLLTLVVAVVLVAVAAFCAWRGSRLWLVVGSFVLAVALGLVVFDTDERLGWTGSSGVYGYESPHGGPLLQPSLDELHVEARRSPEARDPGWTLVGTEHSYAARGLGAWRVFVWSTLILLWLTGYRLARLALRPWASVWLVAGVTTAIFVWLFVRALGTLA
jgi:hypothetical protein